MAKYQVDLSAAAQRDLGKIRDYIALDKPRAADKWLRKAHAQIRSLSENPQRYEHIPEIDDIRLGYRHIIFGNYRIVYRIVDEQIRVIRVIHAARLFQDAWTDEND